MTNLLQRILGKERKPKVETRFDAGEVKPFFESLGVDIESIGFPEMEKRKWTPTERYWINFENVNVTPIKSNGMLKQVITGDYETMAMASYQGRNFDWHPGEPTRYSFRIEDGKLELKRREK